MKPSIRAGKFIRWCAGVSAAAVGLFYAGLAAHAQVDTGITYATASGLMTGDIRTIIARIVNAFLGLLGIVAVVIIMYGGWIYMSAAGEETKIQKAKDIIKNGVIGLGIILSAYAIAYFVIGAIQSGTGTSEPGGDTGGGGGGCTFNCSQVFQVRDVFPSGAGSGTPPSGYPRNSVITANFRTPAAIKSTTVTSASVTVEKCNPAFTRSGQEVTALPFSSAGCTATVDGKLDVQSKTVTFSEPATPDKYFEADTWYRISFKTSIADTRPVPLDCTSTGADCAFEFAVNNEVDTTGPAADVWLTQPVCAGQTVPVSATATDNSAVRQLDFLLNGTSFDVQTNAGGGKSFSTTSSLPAGTIKDTTPFSLGLIAYDTVQSTTVSKQLALLAGHCCNKAKDADETAVDCGGKDCNACAGGSCQTDADCSGNMRCVNNRCTPLPEITGLVPSAGGPGTLVSVEGSWFGANPGKVIFLGTSAAGDDKSAAACASGAWRQCGGTETTGVCKGLPAGASAVQVAVPEGAVSGPIQVVTAADLSDRTDDANGPKLGDFNVNNQVLPGICQVTPEQGLIGDAFSIFGSGFGIVQGGVKLAQTGSSFDAIVSQWPGAQSAAGTPIAAAVPAVPEGQYKVKVTVGGQETANDVWYTVQSGAGVKNPNITDITPKSGPPGTYVTLSGANFSQGGNVYFYTGAAPGNSDTTAVGALPPSPPCGNTWSDGTVVIKVPEKFKSGIAINPTLAMKVAVEASGSGGLLSNAVDFSVTSGTPGPGVCSITPSFGPIAQPVTLRGESFGSGPANAVDKTKPYFGVVFYGGKDLRCSFNIAKTCATNADCANTSDGICIPNPVAAAVDSWSSGTIPAYVPAGAQSGPVRVVAENKLSDNSVPFTVGNCKEAGGDKLCRDKFPGQGLICCASGACDSPANCAVTARRSAFGWRFSTAVLPELPVVVESQTCDATSGQSPSPYKESTDACVNADLRLEFNRPMWAADLKTATAPTNRDAATVIVEKCATQECVGATFVPAASTVPQISTVTGGNTAAIIPLADNFDANTWYRVTVYGQVGRGLHDRRDGSAGKLLDGDRDSKEGGNYVYKFRTRADGASCDISNVAVDPVKTTIRDQYDVALNAPATRFTASLRAANCNIINACPVSGGTRYAFAWSADAQYLAFATASSGECRNQTDAGGLKETPADTTLAVSIADASAARSLTRTGESSVSVKFADPAVVSYKPNCDAACINAPLVITFNVRMDQASFVTGQGKDVDTVQLFKCRNASCNAPFAAEMPIRVSEFRSSGTGAATVVDSVAIVSLLSGNLDPDSYYFAQLRGKPLASGGQVIMSRTGKALVGLNNGDFFSWKFKTKKSATPCAPFRTTVEPPTHDVRGASERVELHGVPFGAPDECDKNGQELDPRDYDWTWSAAATDVLVKGFLPTVAKNGFVDTAVTGLVGCRANCTLTGSQSVQPQCGNGLLEKGEDCDLVSGSFPAWCDPAKCLLNGNNASSCGNGAVNSGEQCDKISGVLPPGCSAKCLFTGAKSGNSVCGDGEIGDGEACDDSNATDGDGCSKDCLHEGTLPSCWSALNKPASPVPGLNCNAFCGNGYLEPGEDSGCDLGGGRVAAGCDANTCLKNGHGQTQCTAGLAGCSADGLLLGSSFRYATPSFCRDESVGAGEAAYCEQGNSALGIQPVQKDNLKDPVQFVETFPTDPALGATEQVFATVSGVASDKRGSSVFSGPPGVAAAPNIGPNVPEIPCTAPGVAANPSPFRAATNACVGGNVSVLFSTEMQKVTDVANVEVADCGNDTAPDTACATKLDLASTLGASLSVGQTRLTISNPGLAAGHWYRVTLKSGVNGITDTSVPARPLDGKKNGGSDDYVYSFRVNGSVDDCRISSAAVDPAAHTIAQFGYAGPEPDGFKTMLFTNSCAIVPCDAVRASAVRWDLRNKDNNANFSDAKLTLEPAIQAAVQCSIKVKASGMPAAADFRVRVQATPAGGTTTVPASAPVTVAPRGGPRVVDRACAAGAAQPSSPSPYRDSVACPNVGMYFDFDRPMTQLSAALVKANLEIRSCGTGAQKGSCTPVPNQNFSSAWLADSELLVKTLQITGISPAFADNTWYEVALKPGFTDVDGLHLETGSQNEYAFSFRVKNGPICRITSAALAPAALRFTSKNQIQPTAIQPLNASCNLMECTDSVVTAIVRSWGPNVQFDTRVPQVSGGFLDAPAAATGVGRCLLTVQATKTGSSADAYLRNPDYLGAKLTAKDDQNQTYTIYSSYQSNLFDKCSDAAWAQCKASGQSCNGTSGSCAAGPEVMDTYPAGANTVNPPPNGNPAANVCRNTFVSVTLDRPLKADSAQADVLLVRLDDQGCGPGEQQVAWATDVKASGPTERGGLWNMIVRAIRRLFGSEDAKAAAPVYCEISAYSHVQNGAEVQLLISEPLLPNTSYATLIKPTATDVAGTAKGQVTDPVEAYVFRTGDDLCVASSIAVSPKSLLLQRQEDAKPLTVTAITQEGQRIVPVSSYYWRWQWSSGDAARLQLKTTSLFVKNQSGTNEFRGQLPNAVVQPAVSAPQGNAVVDVSANFWSRDKNGAEELVNALYDSATAVVMYCDNPWPASQACGNGPVYWTWDPSAASAAPQCVPARYCSADASRACTVDADCVDQVSGRTFGTCRDNTAWSPYYDPSTNISFYYCRDGQSGGEAAAALPAFKEQSVAITPGPGIVREFLLSYQNAVGKDWEKDVVALRIYQNPSHVSLSRWYADRGLSGTPKPVVIGGYQALRGDRTVYVSSAAVASATGATYTNVNVFSYNDGASVETRSVFDQVVANADFNRTVKDSRTCVGDWGTPGAIGVCSKNTAKSCALGEPCAAADGDCVTDVIYGRCQSDTANMCGSDADCGKDDRCLFGKPYSCSSDLDCRTDAAGTTVPARANWVCGAQKQKLIRDVKRWADITDLRSTVFQSAIPPLEQGTYLRSMSVSLWPSWTGSFGQSLAASAPADPLNRFMTCQSGANYNPDVKTCWDSKSGLYKCPTGSHVYTYESVGGQDFRLKADLEQADCAGYSNQWYCDQQTQMCRWTYDSASCTSWAEPNAAYWNSLSDSYYASSWYCQYYGLCTRAAFGLQLQNVWWVGVVRWDGNNIVPIVTNAVCNQYSGDATPNRCWYNQVGCFWQQFGGSCKPLVQWKGGTCIEQMSLSACQTNSECIWSPTTSGLTSGPYCQYRTGAMYVGGVNSLGGSCKGDLQGIGGVCGDGIVGTGELCEPGKPPTSQSCTITTVANRCRYAQTVSCSTDADCATGSGANNGPCDKINETRAGSQTVGCTSQCQLAAPSRCLAGRCGDGVVQSPETCDDGTLNGTYGHCNSSCNAGAQSCGDGIRQLNELCDCSSQNGVYSFNSILSTDLSCPNQASPLASCSWDCKAAGPRCGDGLVNGSAEQCDGGAEESRNFCVASSAPVGAACSAASPCQTGTCVDGRCNVCGAGMPACGTGTSCQGGQCVSVTSSLKACAGDADCAAGEKCANACPKPEQKYRRTCGGNDPNVTADDVRACKWNSWTCTAAGTCGDGATQSGEECDDGNPDNHDNSGACIIDKVKNYMCKNSRCGDGYRRTQGTNPEQCDSGADNGKTCTPQYNKGSCTYCSNSCTMETVTAPFCGDGILQGPGTTPSGPEECDGAVGMTDWVCVRNVPPFTPTNKLYQDVSLWPRCGNGCTRECPDGYQPCRNSGATKDQTSGLVPACDPDLDNDGVPANTNGTPAASGDLDCNDRDTQMHKAYTYTVPPSTTPVSIPAAPEVCDSKDNDCNDVIDNVISVIGKTVNGMTGAVVGGAGYTIKCGSATVATGNALTDGTFRSDILKDGRCADGGVLTVTPAAMGGFCPMGVDAVINLTQLCTTPYDVGWAPFWSLPTVGYRFVAANADARAKSSGGETAFLGQNTSWATTTASEKYQIMNITNEPTGEGTAGWSNWATGEPNNAYAPSGETQNCGAIYGADGKWDDGYCTDSHLGVCENLMVASYRPYTNWSSGEPNNAGGGEGCTEMYADGKWNDLPCDGGGGYNNLKGLCADGTLTGGTTWNGANSACGGRGGLKVITNQADNDAVQVIRATAGGDIWIGLADKSLGAAAISTRSYIWVDDVAAGSLNWDQAQSYCVQKGSRLAVIKTAAVNEQVRQACANRATALGVWGYCWIGMNDRGTEGVWERTDGSKLKEAKYRFYALRHADKPGRVMQIENSCSRTWMQPAGSGYWVAADVGTNIPNGFVEYNWPQIPEPGPPGTALYVEIN